MTKKQPRDVRVDSILEAAVEVFLEKGYEGASIDAISKRAGVSKGGFYHHFENKEMLLLQANEKLCEPIIIMVEEALKNESPLEGLRKYIFDYLEYWADKPRELSFLFLTMAKSLETPILMDYYREYYRSTMEFFVGLFKSAQEKGELQIKDPEAYGISLMGALDGLVSYLTLFPSQSPRELAERFERVWL